MKPEKTINLLMRDFKKDLKNFIESQSLPAAVIAFIVKDVNNEIQEAYENILSIEEEQYNNALKQQEEDKDDNIDVVSD